MSSFKRDKEEGDGQYRSSSVASPPGGVGLVKLQLFLEFGETQQIFTELPFRDLPGVPGRGQDVGPTGDPAVQ